MIVYEEDSRSLGRRHRCLARRPFMRLVERQTHDELRTVALAPTVHRDRADMELGEPTHRREAEAKPAGGGADLIERLEDAVMQLRGNADARVSDADDSITGVATHRHLDRLSFRCVLHGVLDEI